MRIVVVFSAGVLLVASILAFCNQHFGQHSTPPVKTIGYKIGSAGPRGG